MNVDSSADNVSQKPAILLRLARLILRLLRMFWLFVLVVLLVFLYGLRSGWTVPRQWSDAYFFAAMAQLVMGGIGVYGGTSQTVFDASTVRYVSGADVSKTTAQLYLDYIQKMNFGVRAFIGGLLTLLIAALCLWV